MNPEVALTKINLGSTDLMGVPGGRPDITRQDIMAALGMGNLPLEHYWLALVYYTGDTTYMEELGRKVWMMAVDLQVAHKWPQGERGKEQYRHVAKVALYELLSRHHRICKLCQGDGLRPAGCKVTAPEGCDERVCPRCQGQGVTPMSERQQALQAGIAYQTWRDSWQYRYRHIYQAVYDMLLTVHGHLRKYLADGEYHTRKAQGDPEMKVLYRLMYGRITAHKVVEETDDSITYLLRSGGRRTDPRATIAVRWFTTWEAARQSLVLTLNTELCEAREKMQKLEKALADAQTLVPGNLEEAP